uniref:C2 NT-type domain-containing protein n=1 Tax=Vitis vinifera TaxID=29760 RepID=F6H6Q0_VITVI
MFKSARWRSEKIKIKAVFKLQFQATQVPESRGNLLMISLIPEDVGKPTVRLEKAAVREGTCTWENPIYETVKLIKEKKTGIIHEKIYRFIVSTGSSKTGILGEASINFADYEEATEPLTVSLPLQTLNSGAILHVTIQNMQGVANQRGVEEKGSQATKSRHRRSQSQINGENKNFRVNCGSYATLTPTAQDLGLKNATTHRNPNSLLSPLRQSSRPQEGTIAATTRKDRMHWRSNTDFSVGSASDGSMIDSTNSAEDNFPGGFKEDSDSTTEKLKSENFNLLRQAELSELELQSLRKQIAKECKRGQDLTRKNVGLKEERDALKEECEQLKSMKKCINDEELSDRLTFEREASRVLLEEMRKELDYEKDLNRNLRLQLQKTQDSNSELIIAVRDLEEMLEPRNKEIFQLFGDIENREKSDDNEDQEALEELVEEQIDAKEVGVLQKKMTDLHGEIEVHRKDREELEMHMAQLALDNEVLKQEKQNISTLEQYQKQELMKIQNELSASLATIKELESQVERLEKEIKKQAQKLSESSNAVNELQMQVKSLEKELEKQAQGFEDDLEAMTRAKIEQEQRAIRAEETLRKTRWNNAQSAERLQEEFRRISVEMTSKFDENEKVAMKAVTEANDLRVQKRILEEMLQKANEEIGLIKDQYDVKLQELSNEVDLKTKQIEKMTLDLDKKPKQLEYAEKQEGEKHEASFAEIQMLRAEIERITKKAELERKFASVMKEAEKVQEDLHTMTCMKDDNETLIGSLQSELDNLKPQYSELKNLLFQEVLEKENLMQQVFQLKGDLEKKEEVVAVTENTGKDNNGQATLSDGTQATATTMEQLNHRTTICEEQFQKEAREAGNVTALASQHEEGENTGGDLLNPGMKSMVCLSVQNEMGTTSVQRNVETYSEKEMTVSIFHTNDESNLTELLAEVALLKERNKSMEGELKEMRERYSEISLKFAEVEGERQQLVMTVRNLKNGKKS